MKINNLDVAALEMKYVVFTVVDGENWYYGAWNNFEKALAVSAKIWGQVAPVEALKEV